jgi:anti-sigma B factor antagonist
MTAPVHGYWVKQRPGTSMNRDLRCAVADELTRPTRSADPRIVALPAEIDVTNSAVVLAALSAVRPRGGQIVIADMTATVYCDCTGLAALLTARRQAVQAGAELRVVAHGGQVLRIIEITGLAGVLDVYRTTAAARERPGPEPHAGAEA